MIYCTLDGKKAYPATSENIKVTLENQYVKESGSYTYEISFPLDILENKLVFGNVQRMDVRKSIGDFETCRLYANNRLVIAGKGTVLSITPDTVKLQIVGGKSRVKYNSKFNKHYIDQIVEWDESFTDWNENNLAYLKWTNGYRSWSDQYDHDALLFDPAKSSFLGKEGKFSYNPILNTTDNINSNVVMVFKQDDGTYRHVIMDLAVQPWLMYTLQMVLKAEGYTLERNDFDVYPWNRLVIASVDKLVTGGGVGRRDGSSRALKYRTNYILPHMTVYDFLENVRKLLGGTFVFNENTNKVSFVKKDEISGNEKVSYECEDDFSVEHQEDGLGSMETSNVKYNIEDNSDRDWKDVMSDEVLDSFEIKEYATLTDMNNAVAEMTGNEKYYTIFNVAGDWYIYKGTYREVENSGGYFGGSRSSTSVSNDSRIAVGFFNPIIRDSDSDDYEEISIIPAAVCLEDRTTADKSSSETYYNAHITNVVKDAISEWFIPVMEPAETSFSDKDTVYEAMTEGSSDSSSSDDDDSSDVTLQVFFQSKFMIDVTNKKIVPAGEHKAGVAYMPLVYTDYRQLDIFEKDSTFKETMSLSFKSLGLTDKVNATPINSHNEVTIKFLTDDIPDPTKIYLFRNKKYICSKIEINVKDNGIEKEKTGYFYEI